MRTTLIALVAIVAGLLFWHFSAATADTCSDSCARAYDTCSKGCKNTDCYTKCLNEKGTCMAKCQ
jgi:hypothetical protein